MERRARLTTADSSADGGRDRRFFPFFLLSKRNILRRREDLGGVGGG